MDWMASGQIATAGVTTPPGELINMEDRVLGLGESSCMIGQG